MPLLSTRFPAMGAVACALVSPAYAATEPPSSSIEEIIVTGDSRENDPTRMATDAESLLHSAGDGNDPLKALLNLPGITFGAGDLDRPVVRGAGPADNLFLVDSILLPEVFHELSDSIISANVLRSFDLSGAAVPLPYGNLVGGVIDIKLRQPSANDHSLRIDLSQLKSGAIVEGPLGQDVSAYASYRQNLAHLFLKNFARSNETLEFRMPESSDYTARLHWRGNGASMTATALGSWDEAREVQRKELNLPPTFGQVETRKLDAQSLGFAVDVGAGQWTTTASHVRFSDESIVDNGAYRRFQTDNMAVRSSIEILVGESTLTAGVNASHEDAQLLSRGGVPVCDYLEIRCGLAVVPGGPLRQNDFGLIEAFAGGRLAVSNSLSVDIGGRWVRDFALRESHLEPRIGIDWAANDSFSLYARGSRQHQRPETLRLLLVNSRFALQDHISSWQALGGARLLFVGGWRMQVEGWYKDFRVTDFAGTGLASALDGEAKGLNLLVARPVGKDFDFWAAASRTWSDRSFAATGQAVNYRYDVPWSATLAATWRPGGGWSFGGKWRYQSGVRYTPVALVSVPPGGTVPVIALGTPYSARAPHYARLDLRVEKNFSFSFGDASIYIDALNVLGRRNIALRSYSNGNVANIPGSGLVAFPNDDEGVPRFVGVGIGFKF